MDAGGRIVVTGATGLIGRALCRRWIDQGIEVVAFSRDPDRARSAVPGAAAYGRWSPEEDGRWLDGAVDGAWAVVGLAGSPILGGSLSEAMESRRRDAAAITGAIAMAARKPAVFVYGSSGGAYGFRDVTDSPVDESVPSPRDATSHDSDVLEDQARMAEASGVRTVLLRTGWVLSAEGGGLPEIVGQFRRGFGSWTRPPDQWRPWIHVGDHAALVELALTEPRLSDALNAVAPNPVTSREFARAVTRATGKPARFPTPEWLLRRFFGDTTFVLTRGRRLVPGRACSMGYCFAFQTIDQALADLVPRIR